MEKHSLRRAVEIGIAMGNGFEPLQINSSGLFVRKFGVFAPPFAP
jgi:hypothetical protein